MRLTKVIQALDVYVSAILKDTLTELTTENSNSSLKEALLSLQNPNNIRKSASWGLLPNYMY